MNDAERAAAYLISITRHSSDRASRAAFQSLVMKLVSPGASILDFGCGPGIDAKDYVAKGLNVRAYDNDPAMCSLLDSRCRDEIESGLLQLHDGDYRRFLTENQIDAGSMALITANFAPLNLITDLTELFAAFDRMLGPDGKVLVSVLSPYFVGDMQYLWWWRHLGRLLRRGDYAVAGDRGPIVRRRLAAYARTAAPHFALKALWRGTLSWRRRAPRVIRPGGFAWVPMTTCRFMFLLFTRPT